jgi:hypothetical protein
VLYSVAQNVQPPVLHVPLRASRLLVAQERKVSVDVLSYLVVEVISATWVAQAGKEVAHFLLYTARFFGFINTVTILTLSLTRWNRYHLHFSQNVETDTIVTILIFPSNVETADILFIILKTWISSGFRFVSASCDLSLTYAACFTSLLEVREPTK